MPIFDHFRFLAPLYETFIPARPPQRMMEYLHLPESGIILDAGGGTGRLAQFLLGQRRTVIVLDESHNMLRQASAKPSLHPLRALAEQLPFAPNSIARILMVDALHHVRNQPQTLHEAWRVLQPGGWIVIEEPDIRHFSIKIIALAEKLALMRSHFLAPAQIAAQFHDPHAQLEIETAGSTAWLIIHKPDA